MNALEEIVTMNETDETVTTATTEIIAKPIVITRIELKTMSITVVKITTGIETGEMEEIETGIDGIGKVSETTGIVTSGRTVGTTNEIPETMSEILGIAREMTGAEIEIEIGTETIEETETGIEMTIEIIEIIETNLQHQVLEISQSWSKLLHTYLPFPRMKS